jgi:hypothetical protein
VLIFKEEVLLAQLFSPVSTTLSINHVSLEALERAVTRKAICDTDPGNTISTVL